MIIEKVRRDVRRETSSTILVLLLLVVALIAGLLAMHILVSDSVNHTDSFGMTMSDSDASPVPASDAPAAVTSQACLDGCNPAHSMAAMACVLMLSVPGLLLAIIRPAVSPTLAAHRPPEVSLAAADQTRTELKPPDLTVLSISRT